MPPSRGLAHRTRRYAKAAADAALGWLAVGTLRVLRATNRKHMADLAGGASGLLT